jgi:hypothetical protein
MVDEEMRCTVEFIFQAPSTAEFSSFHFFSWEEYLQADKQEVVCKHPSGHFGIE